MRTASEAQTLNTKPETLNPKKVGFSALFGTFRALGDLGEALQGFRVPRVLA